MARLHTKPPISSPYGGTSVHPPPKSSRAGARATSVCTAVCSARMVLENSPTCAIVHEHERCRAARNERIAAHQLVPCDHVHDVGTEGICQHTLERQRVANAAGSESRSVAGTNFRASAHDSLVRDEGGARSIYVVSHKGIQVTAVPGAGSTVKKRERDSAGCRRIGRRLRCRGAGDKQWRENSERVASHVTREVREDRKGTAPRSGRQ